jgi:hypothetical protein
LITLTFSSCHWSKKKGALEPVARVDNMFLYKSDLSLDLLRGLTGQDSVVQAKNQINKWVTNQLLISGAEFNLNQDTQQQFEDLVQQYRKDLYTSAYLEALVEKNIDTLILSSELEEVYKQNLEVFILNEDLIKLRYINLNSNISNLREIKKSFRRFNIDDQIFLDSISLQFNSFFLKDSVWIKSTQAIEKIKPLQSGFNKVLLKKPNFIQLKDSLGLYLMEIKQVLSRGSQAPLAYVLPTVKQMVINKRKLKLITQLKSEIVNDAIKTNKLEFFD